MKRLIQKYSSIFIILLSIFSLGLSANPGLAQVKVVPHSTQLDRALRAGDVELVKRFVLDDVTAADQLFLWYLQQDLSQEKLETEELRPPDRARRLAEVFFKLFDFDFEMGVVAYWEKANAAKKKELLPILSDHFAVYREERTMVDRALPPYGHDYRLLERYMALAESYRAISFGKGELQARLRASSYNPDKAWKTWQLAKSLHDEVGEAWAAYYFSIWGGEGQPEIAARQALEKAERLPLPYLQQLALTRQAWRALGDDDYDGYIAFFRKGLEVIRTIPVRQTMVSRAGRSFYPGEAWFLLALWRAYEMKNKAGAREMFDQGRALSKQHGGAVGELAYLIDATQQFIRKGLFEEMASLAESLARKLGDSGWLVLFLKTKADGLQGTREFGRAIQAATEASELCKKIGARGHFAECLFRRAVLRTQSSDFTAAVADFDQAIKIYQELGLTEKAASAEIDAGFYLRAQPASALRFFGDAVAAAEKTGDPGLISDALFRRGQTMQTTSPADSIQDFLKAVPYAERSGEEAGIPGRSLGMMHQASLALRRIGNFIQAIDIQKQRVEKARAKELFPIEADAYYWLQYIYSRDLGETSIAAEYIKKWQALIEQPGRKIGVPDYNRYAGACTNIGRPVRALEAWAKALKLAREMPDGEYYQRMIHTNAAQTYLELGDYDAAIGELDEEKALIEKTFDAYRSPIELQQATLLNRMALAHVLAGDLKKAVEESLEAIQLESKTQPGTALAEYYSYFMPGDALALAGRHDEAIDFFIRRRERARQIKSAPGERSALERLGTAYLRAGNIEKAREAFQAAVEIDRKPPGPQTGSLGNSLLALGRLELESGNLAKAGELLLEARKMANPYDMNQIWQVERATAHVSVKQNQPQLAQAHFEQALRSLERTRERFRPEEFIMRYGIDRLRVYNEYASYLAAHAVETKLEADAAKALRVLELRRAQALWDLMATGWARLPEEAVPEQLRRSQEAEARLMAKQNILRDQFNLAPEKRNAALIKTLEADLDQARDEHARLLSSLAQGQYRFSSPASIPEDLVARLRKQLGGKRVLVEYFMADEASFAFVISSAGLRLERLPIGREKLRQNVQGLLQPFYRLRTGELDLTRLGFDLGTAHALYDQLFAPLEPYLKRMEQILVVPDDALFYLPIEMLVDRLPKRTASPKILFAEYDTAGFLVRRFSMSYLMAAFHFLSAAENPQPTGSNLKLLAMANPTASQDYQTTEQENPMRRRLRSASFRAAFAPLPAAAAEIEGICRYYPGNAVTVVTGGKATETIYKTQAMRYGIVHLATHAVAADDQPFYSTLILAPDAEAREDGFLQAYEILRYPLQARLVVLSACETALGPLGRGEGLVGLVSAFQQAGARAVLATQWSIDESSAELMTTFYKGMASGKNIARALREAKLEILKKKLRLGNAEVSLAHPLFWAPFVLIGVD